MDNLYIPMHNFNMRRRTGLGNSATAIIIRFSTKKISGKHGRCTFDACIEVFCTFEDIFFFIYLYPTIDFLIQIIPILFFI